MANIFVIRISRRNECDVDIVFVFVLTVAFVACKTLTNILIKQIIIITFGSNIRMVILMKICNLLRIEQRNACGELTIESVKNDGIQHNIGNIRVITSETIT